ALWLEIIARGRAAHGSMPDLGVNAIEHLARAILALRTEDLPHHEHLLLGRPTLNVGTIRGGSKTNMVADSCAVTVDIRTVPGQDHEAIVAQVSHLLDRIGAAGPECPTEIRVLNDAPPIETDAEDAFVRDVVRAVGDATGRRPTPGGVMYYTDAAALVPALGVPMAICGPGRRELAHQVDEYVEIDKLIEAVEIYRRLIEMRLRGSHG
ncbi:MAG TPA: M20/M25/M40 family metallo-hydrolase, partial [Dehalococcoidia bacterium]|nr:M20/M25/M40 family metallo-hydrolase [Dehalococcoidia bacterium]